MLNQFNESEGLVSPDDNPGEQEVVLDSREIQELAEKIYQLLLEDLMIENERLGRM